MPPLESCGFVRVPSDPGSDSPLYLTCDGCGKSDNFWIDGDTIHCRCGATYTHASRPDGRQIPTAELTFVPWNEGPMNLADTEIDPLRLTLALVLTVALIGAVGVGLWWWMG